MEITQKMLSRNSRNCCPSRFESLYKGVAEVDDRGLNTGEADGSTMRELKGGLAQGTHRPPRRVYRPDESQLGQIM